MPSTNPEYDIYAPKTVEAALARLAEECSEVIKLVCKAQRFGLDDHHPKKLKTNLELIMEELEDVVEAKEDFLRLLAESMTKQVN